MPIGAALLSDKVAATISAGDHGTTYGGNLLACRAALVVLDELDRGLLSQIRRVSTTLFAGLAALKSRHSSIVDVRGAGLMAGIEFATDAAPLVTAALERGPARESHRDHRHRLLPPYIAAEQDINEDWRCWTTPLHRLARPTMQAAATETPVMKEETDS